MNDPLIIGTRTSRLARWQTDHVAGRLQAAWPGLTCQVRPFVTQGDRTLDKPLPQIGGKGLFTLELENGLRATEIDLAVHSLKDLPVEDAPGLTLGAIIGRADVRDALVGDGRSLAELPAGAIIGTSSLRRQAQLLAARPDLIVRSIRGNVPTRVDKAGSGDYDAVVLAAAGLTRLGLEAHVAEWLPLDVMLPAPGQGALAVQCRADDAETLRRLAPLDDAGVRACVLAERTFLHALGGGCATPVGAYAVLQKDGRLFMTGLVAALDGRQIIRVSGEGDAPAELGARLAEEARAQGAAEILGHV